MKPFVVGCTFARGGSKGVPRKNIRLLNGKPLIAYSIAVAKACPLLDRVIVSTEDDEIAEVARRYGAEVPFKRPSELAQDSSPEWLAWQHAIKTLAAQDPARAPGVLVSIPATSPFRSVADVEACVTTLLESEADLVLCVVPSTRSPYFNMVAMDEAGYVKVVVTPETPIARRQDAPKVFDLTTLVYAARADFILRAKGTLDGKVKAVVVAPERGLDIDSELDFKFAEFLVAHGQASLPMVEERA